MPFSMGPFEMVLVFLVVLLLFGAKRLPEIGTSLGKGIREFKSSLSEVKTSMKAEGEVAAAREQRAVEAPEEGAPKRLTTG